MIHVMDMPEITMFITPTAGSHQPVPHVQDSQPRA
jgi:hypothetical protein